MTDAPSSEIQNQVKLPVQVAFQVVMQGLKIRLGRSLVTISGVVLGIAFLMSILTSQILKECVASEQGARAELQRAANFLTFEMGAVQGKTIGLLQTGPLHDLEQRLLEYFGEEGVARLKWHGLSGAALEEVQRLAGRDIEVQAVELTDLVAPGQQVLLLGDGAVTAAQWQQLTRTAAVERVITTRNVEGRQLGQGMVAVPLAQELRPDELKKQAEDQRRATFRNRWMIIISLMVTVMGIANAMLMSVTERFKEIGTMKCLGALSAFIRQIFLFESCLLGAAGGLGGSLLGAVFSILVYGISFGFGLILPPLADSFGLLVLYGVLSFIAGIVLSVIAALYPANVASKMVPAHALRSNV